MEDETLPPHMLPIVDGEVYLAVEGGLFRVLPGDGDDYTLVPVPTN